MGLKELLTDRQIMWMLRELCEMKYDYEYGGHPCSSHQKNIIDFVNSIPLEVRRSVCVRTYGGRQISAGTFTFIPTSLQVARTKLED